MEIPHLERAPHSKVVAGVMSAVFFAIFLIPVDFVEVSRLAQVALYGCITAGSAISLVMIGRTGNRGVLGVLVVAGVLCILSLLTSGSVSSFVGFFGPLVVGIGYAVVIRDLRRPLLLALVIIAATLVIDRFAGAHVVSELFGTPLREGVVSLGEFRARGIIGQPVPAAMIATAVSVYLIVANGGRSAVYGLLIVVLLAASLITTGTRSALILSVGCFGVMGIVAIFSRSSAGFRLAGTLGILAAIFVTAVPTSWWANDTIVARLTDLAGVQGTDSLSNRQYAFEVLEIWSKTCNAGCATFGAGYRDLQSSLGTSFGGLGYSTVDNAFVTVLWDFGLLGLMVLVAFSGVCILTLFRTVSWPKILGAVGCLVLLLSGLFYDFQYIRPSLLLFGVFVGLMTVRAGTTTGQAFIAPSSSVMSLRGKFSVPRSTA